MARNVIDRQLTARSGRVEFAVASDGDDAAIRQLLRDNPMAGQISLSFEREPDYFADAHLPGETKQTIVAREGSNVLCAGSCTIRERFVNGVPCRVGYLGGLRLDARLAGRFDVLRQGYEFFRELQTDSPADFYFTSIASDNQRARWFLERGLRGMPTYKHLGDFVTLLLPTRTGRAGRDETEHKPTSWAEVVAMLNHCNARHQFAPHWTEGELAAYQSLGLGIDDFCYTRDASELACAAIWDQRVFKQTVIRGYSAPLKQARALANLASRITGGIRLPAIGETLSNAFVFNLTTSESPARTIQMVKILLRAAAGRKIEMLTLGFAANDRRLSWLRQNFRGREYHSRLYLVRWPDLGGKSGELDERGLCPEVALL